MPSRVVSPMGDFRWLGPAVVPGGGRFGVVLRTGPGIRVTRTNGEAFTVTTDDAETGAALLNALGLAPRGSCCFLRESAPGSIGRQAGRRRRGDTATRRDAMLFGSSSAMHDLPGTVSTTRMLISDKARAKSPARF